MKTDFKAILLVDFDDTICEVNWPVIKGFKPGALSTLRQLEQENFCIIINTCRSGVHLTNALQYLVDNNCPFHLANENHPALIDYFGEDCRKLSGDIYIDDKNLCALIDKSNMHWTHIYRNIHRVTNHPSFKSILNCVNQNVWP